MAVEHFSARELWHYARWIPLAERSRIGHVGTVQSWPPLPTHAAFSFQEPQGSRSRDKALRSSSTSSRPSFRSRRAPKANCYHRAIAKWATDFSVLRDCDHHKIVLASETCHYRAPTLEYAAPPSPHHRGLCPSHCEGKLTLFSVTRSPDGKLYLGIVSACRV